MLRFAGPFRLVHAVDGQAALEMTRSERPDLILLDLNLPRISGQDVLIALRAGTDTSSIPVAILTAAKFEEGQIPSPMNHAIAVLSKDMLADAASLEIEAGPPVRVWIKSN
jgi:CheY-like chemotaxis protein